MDKIKTGEMIREARLRKNYTQNELGDLLGVSNKAISRWENGDSFPDVGVLENLANVLELPIQDIVIGKKSEDNTDAVVEVVRIAKLQGKTNNEKLLHTFIGAMVIIYAGFLAYAGLSSRSYIEGNAVVVYGLSCALNMALIIIEVLRKGNHVVPVGSERLHVIMTSCCVVALSAEIFIMFFSFLRMSEDKTIFGMVRENTGPFVEGILTVIAVFGVFAAAACFQDIVKNNRVAYTPIIMAICMIYMSGLNGDLLHRLSLPEAAIQILVQNTVVIMGEMLITIVLAAILVKVRKGMNME